MYDAIVIGAGPAGATAARLLAQSGWSVALVEKTAFPRPKVCGEFISATSLPLLSDRGVSHAFHSRAGPEVKRVGLFAGKTVLACAMPAAVRSSRPWGRAMARDQLDTLLARAATEAGADIWQPWKLTAIQQHPTFATVLLASGNQTRQLEGRCVIAAIGSWERNSLSSATDQPHSASDLLAFKAHFRNTHLASDLMPLIVFPGGYGGMVHTSGGCVSISLCIRRDALEHCRETQPGRTAAEAVFQHITSSCKGVREALSGADVEGHWLAAGPIRPGFRPCFSNGVFFAGNIAGEAHPLIAEGISMGMQSAWILSHVLNQHRDQIISGGGTEQAGWAYRAEWHNAFARRIRASALFAKLALSPRLSCAAHNVVRHFPGLLNFGAKLSGKAMQVVG
jgi:flavin-dependent dehydrogenase